MEKAFEFLSSHKDVAFVTVEQDKPKIRVFQIMKQEGHTLYFATSPHKNRSCLTLADAHGLANIIYTDEFS